MGKFNLKFGNVENYDLIVNLLYRNIFKDNLNILAVFLGISYNSSIVSLSNSPSGLISLKALGTVEANY